MSQENARGQAGQSSHAGTVVTLDAQDSTAVAAPASEPVHAEPDVTAAPPKRPRLGTAELALPTPVPGTPRPAAPPVALSMPRPGRIAVWCTLDELDTPDRFDYPTIRFSIRVRGHAVDGRPLTLWVEVGESVGTRSTIRLLQRAVAALERRIAPRRPRRVRGAR
jgi:hypothetical protein